MIEILTSLTTVLKKETQLKQNVITCIFLTLEQWLGPSTQDATSKRVSLHVIYQ